MVEIIGVRFKEDGKIYYFDPGTEQFQEENMVIVETIRGVECGKVVFANRMVQKQNVVYPLKPVTRKATEQDLRKLEENKLKEKEAFDICVSKIEKHKLKMKLLDVEYTFDGDKILFYFTADGRVDFRELVKDLAFVFRTRIELRQIGVRDEAKMLGGLGICGQPFCCATFLRDFQPVSIKMAKEQGLSLNPTKISGVCGRLMCCLKYEQDTYEELLKITPKVGAIVGIGKEKGTVIDSNIFSGMVTVRMEKEPQAAPKVVHRRDVLVIKDAKIVLSPAEIRELKKLEE